MGILSRQSSTAHNQCQAPIEAFPARAGQKPKEYGTKPECTESTFATRYYEKRADVVVSPSSFAVDSEDAVVAGN